MVTAGIGFGTAEKLAAEQLIRLALQEDLGPDGDVTSKAVIPENYTGQANYVARQAGIIAGLPLIQLVCQAVDPALQVTLQIQDGTLVSASTMIARLSGPLRSILAAERTSLNFLQRLSGIASQTHQYVELIAGLRCHILDTRKTTPGWRALEKYAVRCGGGTNHRIGLYDAVMIKDNHLAGLREHGTPIAEAVRRARDYVKGLKKVEVEVDSLAQLTEALTERPDIVLLDNMPVAMLREAVVMRNEQAPAVRLEASGGITLKTVRAVAETGVDCISVGALTHSAIALDIALDYIE